MRSPAFQFYPGDWMRNANLKRCSFAERGVWIEVMCLMHDSEVYGVLRWPMKEIAQAIRCPMNLLRGLIDKGVLKGADAGQTCDPLIYIPRSGRKDGDAVVLVPATTGPIWYSSRMVRDEYVRSVRGASTRFTESSNATPNPPPKPPFGEAIGAAPTARQGDGPASAVAFASAVKEKLPTPSDGKPSADPPQIVGHANGELLFAESGTAHPSEADTAKFIFDAGVRLLTAAGKSDESARKLLGRLRGEHGNAVVTQALKSALKFEPPLSEPAAWLFAACASNNKHRKPVDIGPQDYAAGWGEQAA